MDDAVPPADERSAPRQQSGARPRVAQGGQGGQGGQGAGDPRRDGQPRPGQARPTTGAGGTGAARRPSSRASRPVIDPLLAASRGESPTIPSGDAPRGRRPKPSESASRAATRREVDRNQPIARDLTGSAPLTIRDDPSLDLGSGALVRPSLPVEPDITAEVPVPVASAVATVEPDVRKPETRDAPKTPQDGAPGDSARNDWSLEQLLDRGPTVLPVIVPAEPMIEPEQETVTPESAITEAAAPTIAPERPAPPPPPTPPVVAPPLPSSVPTVAVALVDPIGGAPMLGDPSPEPQADPAGSNRSATLVPRRPRVRRVTRVVRHVDTWSVFKVALVFNLFLYVVALTSGVLLWQVAQNTGTVDNVERFFESFGWQHFALHGGEIFHNAWIAGLFAVIGLTGLAVLMATLFNLITDLVGGIRVSVLEEEVVAREDRGVGWRPSMFDRLLPKGTLSATRLRVFRRTR